MIKRLSLGFAALMLLMAPLAGTAHAANPPGISQKVAPCDWSYPNRCLKVNADGSINTSGSGGSSYTVTGGAAGGLANLFTPAGGSDGTTYRMFKTDSSGVQQVADGALLSAVNSPIPAQAGTVIIGGVGFDTANNAVKVPAATTGGAAPLITAALTNTAVAIKASAGTLYMVRCYNPNASAAYVQIYNIASGSVTVGTSTASQLVGIAATSAGGFAMAAPGIAFATAISYAATTTATGSTAPGTALSCSVAYL